MKNIRLKKGAKYIIDYGWCVIEYPVMKPSRVYKVVPKRKDNWETKDKSDRAQRLIKFRLKWRQYAFIEKDDVIFTDKQEYYAGSPYLHPDDIKEIKKKYKNNCFL